MTDTIAIPSNVGSQNAYSVPPGNYQVCNVNAYDNTKACQSIAEPPPPPPTSCVRCSPPCNPGYICEIVGVAGGDLGLCVLNHRCMMGYHFCGGKCVPSTGLCP